MLYVYVCLWSHISPVARSSCHAKPPPPTHLVRLRREDGVLLDVRDDDLDDGRGEEVADAADAEKGPRVREGHRVKLRHHGEGAGDHHEAELDVVPEEVLVEAQVHDLCRQPPRGLGRVQWGSGLPVLLDTDSCNGLTALTTLSSRTCFTFIWSPVSMCRGSSSTAKARIGLDAGQSIDRSLEHEHDTFNHVHLPSAGAGGGGAEDAILLLHFGFAAACLCLVRGHGVSVKSWSCWTRSPMNDEQHLSFGV